MALYGMEYRQMHEFWRPGKVVRNPHKGWYLHYFDNCLNKYLDLENPDDYLEDFPGLHHIYLRLAWCYLEPEEGNFNWGLIDDVIDRWVARGYRISMRVSCKETSPDQCYATPKWVEAAGARGKLIGGTWEPDYGDPVFLSKLENFHRAFAARYDGAPWLEYVDIGSYGDWGEGHTEAGSDIAWPESDMLEHLRIHDDNYHATLLMANADMLASRREGDGSQERLLAHFVSQSYGLRVDCVCVGKYGIYPISTIDCTEHFQPIWPRRPVDLELAHYSHVRDRDSWKNGWPMLAATLETHATYAGFHGYAREFLRDNPEFARMMANVLGYWFFPRMIWTPGEILRGAPAAFAVSWQNRGAAPAYHSFVPFMRLRGANGSFETQLAGSDTRGWMPHALQREQYAFRVPAELPAGDYELSVGLFELGKDMRTPIRMSLADELERPDGFYCLAPIRVLD